MTCRTDSSPSRVRSLRWWWARPFGRNCRGGRYGHQRRSWLGIGNEPLSRVSSPDLGREAAGRRKFRHLELSLQTSGLARCREWWRSFCPLLGRSNGVGNSQSSHNWVLSWLGDFHPGRRAGQRSLCQNRQTGLQYRHARSENRRGASGDEWGDWWWCSESWESSPPPECLCSQGGQLHFPCGGEAAPVWRFPLVLSQHFWWCLVCRLFLASCSWWSHQSPCRRVWGCWRNGNF